MVIGHGIDIIEIDRFAHWHEYSLSQLQKVFSLQEITYCLQVPSKSAERFAARFAAKEAFFKASQTILNTTSFFAVCSHVEVHYSYENSLQLYVSKKLLTKHPIRIFLTLTHAKTMACASIILELAE